MRRSKAESAEEARQMEEMKKNFDAKKGGNPDAGKTTFGRETGNEHA